MNTHQRLEKIKELALGIRQNVQNKNDREAIAHAADAIYQLSVQTEEFIQFNLEGIESRLNALK